jgi:hypothetical protein
VQTIEHCTDVLFDLLRKQASENTFVSNWLAHVDRKAIIDSVKSQQTQQSQQSQVAPVSFPLSLPNRKRLSLRCDSSDKENDRDSSWTGGRSQPMKQSPLLISTKKVPFRDLPRAAQTKAKSPLKVMPLNLQEQIQHERNKLISVKSDEAQARAAKWQKPATITDQDNMKAAIEKRIETMRKFLSDDHDNHTVTESMDMSFTINSSW